MKQQLNELKGRGDNQLFSALNEGANVKNMRHSAELFIVSSKELKDLLLNIELKNALDELINIVERIKGCNIKELHSLVSALNRELSNLNQLLSSDSTKINLSADFTLLKRFSEAGDEFTTHLAKVTEEANQLNESHKVSSRPEMERLNQSNSPSALGSFTTFCSRLAAAVVALPLFLAGFCVTLVGYFCAGPLSVLSIPFAGMAAIEAPQGKKLDAFNEKSHEITWSAMAFGVFVLQTSSQMVSYAAHGSMNEDELKPRPSMGI